MNQVGQTKIFALSVTPPASSGVYAYCWRFWDGTVVVTTEPRVEKRFNLGGDPNNSRRLYFTCQPVMEDGRSVTLTDYVEVNNPPKVVPSPVISQNDAYFPYDTEIRLTAYDVEGDAISFLYYDSSGAPIGGGVTSAVGSVNGTWNGTHGMYSGFENVFEASITAETTITLKIVDAQSGTQAIDFDFYGNTPVPPVIGVTADPDTLTADASSIPDQRIGPGQQVSFTVYAADPVSSNFVFTWSFWGSYGWAANSFVPGSSEPTADGGVRNVYVKDLSGESGGSKTVLVEVVNSDSGKQVEIPVYVDLIANSTGTSCTFTVKDQDGTSLSDGDSVPAGTKLVYTATVVDPQNDVLRYRWDFTQPSGLQPNPLRLWGREVVYDTTGIASGQPVLVTVLTVDRMEGQASFSAPTISID